MSSSQQTYYSMKRLHVLFAVSSALLAVVTIWMFAEDHFRPWKEYQRTYRDRIEPWLTQARVIDEESGDFQAEEEKLRAALAKAESAVPPRTLIERFRARVAEVAPGEDFAAVEAAYRAMAAEPSRQRRERLLAELRRLARRPLPGAENLERDLRFRRAEFDQARTAYEEAVGEARPPGELARLKGRAEAIKAEVERLARAVEKASAEDAALADLVAEIDAPRAAAAAALEAHRARLEHLRRTLARQQPNWGKRLLRMPFIDALGRPLAVEQIWLPKLTIDYNFRRVARFDRCTTCHLGIDKTRPGSPGEAALPGRRRLSVELATPEEPPSGNADGAGGDAPTAGPVRSKLTSLYGLALADRDMLGDEAATIKLVLPRSPAADARLEVGDRLLRIGDRPLGGRQEARRILGEGVARGQPAALEIERGLPQPYCSHPRLDLFVGSASPHPVAKFGCTICHAGQGSATAFSYASHTPNTPADRRRWGRRYGWFENKHWDFPMLPKRFAESSCLQCHHDVVDLEPSERFLDPPAAKLVAGYHLVRRNGCFGCHEIRGFDGSGRRIGPDMRLEPPRAEAALQLLAVGHLTREERTLAEQVTLHPQDARPRHRLVETLRRRGPSEKPGEKERRRLLGLLAAEPDHPGTMRKVGPSLRDVAGRLDADFLRRWTAAPAAIRPDTRMPRFYGLHEHLDGRGLKDAERFEAVELRAVAKYLLAASQPVEPRKTPAEVTETPSAERGRELFVRKGCVACHRHEDVPQAVSTFGPDLTGLGSKYTMPAARAWLVGWIRDPAHHSPRTLMPNTLLEPEAVEGASEGAGKRMSDPAADIAAYLLESKAAWAEEAAELPGLVEADLDELALMYLRKGFSRRRAEAILAEGIPPETADSLAGDAAELTAPITLEKKLRYVGRRTIGKRGCYGCHDIPGFEGAPPIGPKLSDWGRKQESLLAFEQVHRLLEQSPGTNRLEEGETAADREFYLEAIRGEHREGFLWQKLRAPRSFDYKKVENKGYNQRLTMGAFGFSPAQREAIITFVLGLVARPPAPQYVFAPGRRRRAIVEGRKVLDRYGCAECHALAMERWAFEYDPQEWEDPPESPTFDFVRPRFSPAEIEHSLAVDRRGRGHAHVVGTPLVDPEGELIEDEDDDGNPLYVFSLWEPALIHGRVWRVGGMQVPIAEPSLVRKWPGWGGAFSRLLYPVVAEEAGAGWAEAWGRVPPPLVHEGAQVQPAWLFDYLLDPTRIRPSVVLRMPKYNLSAAEAGRLVDYFSAAGGQPFPYAAVPGRPARRSLAADHRQRLDAAMRLLIDRKTFCAKCHLIGDFDPGGDTQTILAPDLAQVGGRIRPEYLRRWLADPKSVLPYTGMPVNFPPTGPPMGQDLLEGGSRQQIEAVADLLMNYEQFISLKHSIRAMIESAPGASPSAAGAK